MAQVTTAARKTPKTFQFDPDAIYLTDNGAAYCGAHLGVTAQRTGRDVSGQRILRLGAEDAAWWQKHNAAGQLPKCETCQKAWTK